ncbi:acyltransferase family protein [Asticcacaulis solisilvae]|uniref:acyltransferase family protein n=1 Tax=Asticcacaulis solisilvae TaxID=1217274 RepID=UPI003FD6D19E
MTHLFKLKAIDVAVVLRAVAICLVAFNHANPDAPKFLGFSLDGGMNVLLMISGYYFAKLVLTAPSVGQMRHQLIRYGASFIIPSFLMVLFFFALLKRFDVQELLFYKNFFSPERVSKYPTWYPQVMLQILLIIYALSFIPGLGAIGRRLQPYWVLGVFGVFAVIRLVLPQYVDTVPLMHHLPHLQFWNFCLGWCFYFVSDPSGSPLRARLAMAGVALVSIFAIFGPNVLVTYTLSIGSLLFLFVKRISLPAIAHKTVSIIAAASFNIFLWHRFFYEIYERVAHLKTPQGGVGMWVFGVGLSIVLWSVWEGLEKTWNRIRSVSDQVSQMKPALT